MDRLIHDSAAGLAGRLVEIISPLLGHEERQEALRAFYAAIRVELEAFRDKSQLTPGDPGRE